MSYDLSDLSQRLFVKALEREAYSTKTYRYCYRHSSVFVTSEFYVLENNGMRVDVEHQKTTINYSYERSRQMPLHRGFIDISQDGKRIFTATRTLGTTGEHNDMVEGNWRVHLVMNEDEILDLLQGLG